MSENDKLKKRKNGVNKVYFDKNCSEIHSKFYFDKKKDFRFILMIQIFLKIVTYFFKFSVTKNNRSSRSEKFSK